MDLIETFSAFPFAVSISVQLFKKGTLSLPAFPCPCLCFSLPHSLPAFSCPLLSSVRFCWKPVSHIPDRVSVVFAVVVSHKISLLSANVCALIISLLGKGALLSLHLFFRASAPFFLCKGCLTLSLCTFVLFYLCHSTLIIV